jgi:ABC-type protease/lipase transport system fused ATPase/permease subunit
LSFFINFFILTSPIYMMQIFDRVLVSGSLATLGMLTLITVLMVGAQAFFDLIRARLAGASRLHAGAGPGAQGARQGA